MQENTARPRFKKTRAYPLRVEKEEENRRCCTYNVGVICEEKEGCDYCGWNPEEFCLRTGRELPNGN